MSKPHVLDTIDDTKLLSKSIVAPIAASAPKVYSTSYNHNARSVHRVLASTWDGTQEMVGQKATTEMCVVEEGDEAFVIAELCEALVRRGDEAGTGAARARLKERFGDEGTRKAMQGGEAKGKMVLLDKLAAL